MTYEYKTVGAPEKGRRKRGAKTRSDKVAAAVEEILGTEAVDGWEYMRTDLVPVIERSGLFGRSHEVHRAVMVFRRPLDRAAAVQPAPLREAEPRRVPSVVPPPVAVLQLEPMAGEDPDLRLAEQVRLPSGPSGRR